MKKILAILALVGVSSTAFADPHWGHGYGGHDDWRRPYPGYRPPVVHEYYGNGYSSTGDVLVPMIIGGVVGYAIHGAQQPQQPVIVQQQPQVIQRVDPSEPVYQYQTIHDAACDCDKRVLVKIN